MSALACMVLTAVFALAKRRPLVFAVAYGAALNASLTSSTAALTEYCALPSRQLTCPSSLVVVCTMDRHSKSHCRGTIARHLAEESTGMVDRRLLLHQ